MLYDLAGSALPKLFEAFFIKIMLRIDHLISVLAYQDRWI
jgi:hypothetical protein